MDVFCFYKEFLIPVPRERAFRVMVLDAKDTLVKVAPNVIDRVEFVSGDGGPGSIRRTVFKGGSELAALGDVKYRIDALDTENCIYRETVVEGRLLLEKMHSVMYEVRFEALGPNRCILKIATEYHPREGFPFNEEKSLYANGRIMNLYKSIEEYLVELPDVCS